MLIGRANTFRHHLAGLELGVSFYFVTFFPAFPWVKTSVRLRARMQAYGHRERCRACAYARACSLITGHTTLDPGGGVSVNKLVGVRHVN